MNKHRKYDDKMISEEIKKYGFELLEFVTTKEIHAIDKNGYRYKLTLTNLRSGRKPNRFFNNPYAIENIRNYLQLNCPNYSLLDDEYKGVKEKLRFICSKHLDKGIQLNSVDNIVNNHHYCKYCAYDAMRDSRVISKQILEQLCNDKKVQYVDQFTHKHETQVVYCCQSHITYGEQIMGLTHFKESFVPCRYCNISIGELKISQLLNKYGIVYETEKIFDDCRSKRPLRFDFYLPNNNILIEFDGRQHFEPVKFWSGMDAEKNYRLNQIRDKIKDDYCKEHNIELIRIPYTQLNNIERILTPKKLGVVF